MSDDGRKIDIPDDLRDDIPDLVDGVPVEPDDTDDTDTDDTDDTDSPDPDPDPEPDPDIPRSTLRAPDGAASDVDVDVTDEIRLQARYKAIHEAREHVTETLRDLSNQRMQALQTLSPKMGSAERREEAERMVAVHLKDTVTAYVTEIEPLLSRLDGGTYYYHDLPLGKITFDELRLRVQQDAPGLNRGPGVDIDERRHPDPVEITGLAEYLEAPDTFERELTTTVEKPGILPGNEDLTRQQVIAMPADISRAAFRAANEFCADIGLGLQPSDANEDASFSPDRI
jgi:hypothetical protein